MYNSLVLASINKQLKDISSCSLVKQSCLYQLTTICHLQSYAIKVTPNTNVVQSSHSADMVNVICGEKELQI